MSQKNPFFSLDELKDISDIISCIYDDSLTLAEFTSTFMGKLLTQIYFDKSDFMFYTYNASLDRYEMHSFKPTNWTDAEIDNYINTYMHMDDVIPILSQPEYITFRNSDLFSFNERRKTKYFKEFARDASLEISIDANIPLPKKYGIIAILGLFRRVGRVEFTIKDLEIIKILQPHLTEGIARHLSRDEKSYSYFNPALDKFDTLGICTLDNNLRILTNNASFSMFAKNHGTSLDDSQLTSKVIDLAFELKSDPTIDKLGPLPVVIDDHTYMVHAAYNDTRKKLTAIVYYISDIFEKRLTSLKIEYCLTNREFEIIYMMFKKSLTADQIADDLFISPATVKRHIATAYQKIGVNNQKQLLNMLKIF
ncbi:MAG: helix-turn-helix transcriptional regulator [Anaerovoracaceae bacterium]